MGLIEEIKTESQVISTDAYSMSIGELVSMYKNGEINIRPEFQRYFRWSLEQKSRLIESVLLGIPLPPIFVQQNEDGKWELVDGLQRVSTFLEVMGELLDSSIGNKKPPLTLLKTKHLPSLDGCSWNCEGAKKIPDEVKLKIKRARIDINIILDKSNVSAKYELFQRLNTGGSIATEQEVRNCLLIMANNKFFKWISSLREDVNFVNSSNLSERLIEEQYDMELITRFFIFKNIDESKLSKINDLSSFLDDRIIEIASDKKFNYKLEKKIFKSVFFKLNSALEENAFKKYDLKKEKPVGSFLISVFEIMALGLGYHHGRMDNITEDDIVKVHKSLFSGKSGASTGMRASTRLSTTIKLGRERFNEDSN
jgi:hypothetical protein